MALSPKEERELVTKLEDMFQSALEHPSWQEWRSVIAPRCFRYREGDQWTATERATLKKRHQPEITNNQVSVTINRLVGHFVKHEINLALLNPTPTLVINKNSRAGVVEWQTRRTQNPVGVTL